MPQSRPAVYAVTRKGADLGRRLAETLEADLFVPDRLATETGARGYAALGELVAATFQARPAHVFVCACGIAVRAIAPHLQDKYSDPAVICLDDAGTFAISLLSGHCGGANALAREAAACVGAVPVVTTATDAAGAPAVELLARERGLALDNPQATRRINAVLAAGGPVAVFDPLGLFPVDDPAKARFFVWVAAPEPPEPDMPLVVVDWRQGRPAPDRLYLRPKALAVGVGCRRGAPAAEILGLIERVCRERGISPASIGAIASIAAKRDEAGILQAAARLGARTIFYEADELAAVAVPHPSATVQQHMGTGSVCEAAAILASSGGRLLVPKTATKRATAAVAV
ncbi:cobalamin (vitamin B12) biosynthesis CbiG protein [Solidesulfovibrio fructosivorans JJ]]|uniref:Cobalamin (Vitamin B12) biosynthesis CbiG protein n=1 Tax=Solidesulfovibrio fructosivorans JJ] TaxID=596151 RepID=E1JZ83_SOLFR|nr:cobalamin biosynthesis protein [Solidesulfovibrio fructosivorans]EFL50366.1 cobalamin (vitamin B12) biosynthesis CbiG protein [Solidesulfovibrio fructosivorans JJ]]